MWDAHDYGLRMRRLFVVLSILALCVPALALADGTPHGRTLVGTLTANASGSVTVTGSNAALTCSVPDRATASVAKLKLGGRFKIACRRDGGTLVLVALGRVGTPGHDNATKGTSSQGTGTAGKPKPGGDSPTTPPPPTAPPSTSGAKDARGKVAALGGGSITVMRDDGTSLTCSITSGQLGSLQPVFPVGAGIVVVCNGDGALVSAAPVDGTPPGGDTHTTPPPPPPPPPPALPSSRDGRGVVTSLSSTGVALNLDGGGTPLTCRITTAADSAAAAAKLSLGAHVGIVCRLDGDHYVLSGVTPIG